MIVESMNVQSLRSTRRSRPVAATLNASAIAPRLETSWSPPSVTTAALAETTSIVTGPGGGPLPSRRSPA
jgi:hypothetical protein